MIVLYASDHGYGHAMRLSVLAEYLLQQGYPVTLCLGAAAQAPWPATLPLRQVSLDQGFVPPAQGLGVDYAATAAHLRASDRGTRQRQRAEEAAFLRALGASLVIADAPALAVSAAWDAGVPAVVCSNFTWLDLYTEESLGPGLTEYLAELAESYSRAALGLRLWPGRMALSGVRRVRDLPSGYLLGRRRTRSRSQVRGELGILDTLPLLCLGLGRSLAPDLSLRLAGSSPKPETQPETQPETPWGAILVPAEDPRPPTPHLYHFPAKALQTQDYLLCADGILAKAGYSTIAEAALASVPLLLFALSGSQESQILLDESVAAGLAHPVSGDQIGELLQDPLRALSLARSTSTPKPQMADAAPLIVQILRDEGLLSAPPAPGSRPT